MPKHVPQVPRCIEGSAEAELDVANYKFTRTRFSKMTERNRCALHGLVLVVASLFMRGHAAPSGGSSECGAASGVKPSQPHRPSLAAPAETSPCLVPLCRSKQKAPMRVWCSSQTPQEVLEQGVLAAMRMGVTAESKRYKRLLDYEAEEAQRKAQRAAKKAQAREA